jgi:hypothetical protein
MIVCCVCNFSSNRMTVSWISSKFRINSYPIRCWARSLLQQATFENTLSFAVHSTCSRQLCSRDSPCGWITSAKQFSAIASKMNCQYNAKCQCTKHGNKRNRGNGRMKRTTQTASKQARQNFNMASFSVLAVTYERWLINCLEDPR